MKFGKIPGAISWNRFFASTSPLDKFGGGGLSGAPLLPLARTYIRNLRSLGVKKHINGGGGILRPSDVDEIRAAGADSVFIGSMAMLRPWRVQATIQRARQIYGIPLRLVKDR